MIQILLRVYNPLKLSYDFLRSQQAKSLVLLCCLFPEDAQIPLEQLTYCCMGLNIFEGIMTMEGARNKMWSLTRMLKSRSLLLDGSKEDRVRMHDVVRDVCKIIAKHENYIGGNGCAWVSSFELVGERRSGQGFPNLRLLLLTRSSKLEEEFKVDNMFIEGIRDLHVLWIENSSLTSLPHGTQPLRNLNTLVLDKCSKLKTVSVVGELVNLEILICRTCHLLEELPPEIKGLNRLKLLELFYCSRLQTIGRGIISNLFGLEELKMFNSFTKWEAEDREERKNAGLKELQALTNLTCLEIEVEDPALVAENMHISTKLDRFHIIFHRVPFMSQDRYLYDKKMSLHLERETCLGHWIEMQLLRETESLCLWGNGSQNADLGKSDNMTWLMISECETTKNIVTTLSNDDVDATVLPASLEYMELRSLPFLQNISISFQNLSSIIICDCPSLPNLGKLSAITRFSCLPQLGKLRIERCEMVEQVFLWNNEGESRIIPHVKFPKLKEVWLVSLPNLATFSQGIEGIEFPLLREIFIENCPKRTSMISCGGILESKENRLPRGSNATMHDEYSSHLFCHLEKVSFGNLEHLTIDRNPFCSHEIPVSSSYNGLETLTISRYEGSRSLLSSSVARNLVNLKELSIQECDEMIQVIKDGDDDEEGNARILTTFNCGETTAPLFPKLKELSLNDLPKLVRFCEWKCDVVMPSLKKLVIQRCPKMKNLSLGFLSAPNVEEFPTDLSHDLELGVNVSFERLKRVWIGNVGNLEYPFYYHKFFTPLVDGLEGLCLHGHGSTSLFPFSVARKLVNLRSLKVICCNEIAKVIEEDEVVSGSGLLFPKLEVLHLLSLPKLVSFCESRCVVELSCLRKVIIYDCPSMKSFSLGPLNAPNLITIEIDYQDFGGDLFDGALQQHYSARAKEEEEEEEEEEDDHN